jgi:hypothetical protein
MVPEEEIPRFYRGCVLNRVVRDSADKLSSIPGVIITPIVASLFATVLTVSQPAPHVHDGLVDSPSLLEAVQYSVGGALVGIVCVVAVVALVTWAQYEISGDPVWTALKEWIDIKGLDKIVIYLPLQGKDLDAVDTKWLVAPECVVQFPTGKIWSFKLFTWNPYGATLRLDYTPPGQYASRWYTAAPGTKRRYEIARRSFYFEPPEEEDLASDLWPDRPEDKRYPGNRSPRTRTTLRRPPTH